MRRLPDALRTGAALLFERDPDPRLIACLETLGFRCTVARREPDAARALQEASYDLVLVDAACAGDFLLGVGGHPLAIPTVVIAAAGSEQANDALDRCAWDWLERPIEPRRVRQVVDRALIRRSLEWQVRDLADRLAASAPPPLMATRCAAVRSLLAALEDSSARSRHVLLRGERGSGRAVFARHCSERRAGPVIEVRCETSVPDEEALSTRIAAAHRGTLLLREVETLSPAIKELLCRRLPLEVRIVATTTRDPGGELAARLGAVEVAVPPLRSRAEDVLPLARHFLAFHAPRAHLTKSAAGALRSYVWPGNLAELRRTVEQAASCCGSELDVSSLPECVFGPGGRGPYVGGDFSIAEIERAHVSKVLARGGAIGEAARTLGVDASTLWRMRKRHQP